MKNTTITYRILLLSIFLLNISATYSQENTTLNKVIESYEDYFKIDRKAIHLHTNKTIFTSGEHIWFSAYLFNKKTNAMAVQNEYVYVNLIDSKGEIISSKTILYENGSASGEFFIKPNLDSGDYFMQAYTPQMNDFNEDDSNILPIRILNFDLEQNEDFVSDNLNLNITITPESGTLLDNELGTLGIQIQDNNGYRIIPDSTFLETSTAIRKPIDISPLGSGQVSFIPTSDKKYVVKSYLGNQIFQTPVSNVKNKGYVLSAKPNLDQRNLWIKVKSRFNETLDSPENLKLVFHKDGNITPIPIETKTTSWSDDIIISFNQLYPGINTFSLIKNDNELVAERIVYNPDTHVDLAPQILKVVKEQDSVKFWVATSGNKTTTPIENLSVSILPSQNLSFTETRKMSSSFYLSDYFTHDKLLLIQSLNKSDARFLDYAINSLLLNKTNGKYAWNTILEKNKINKTLATKKTSCLEGYIGSIKELKNPAQVLLVSNTNKVYETADLNEKLQFKFNNLSLKEKSKFTLTLINKKGKPISSLFFFTLKPDEINFKHAFKPKRSANNKQIAKKDSLNLIKKEGELKNIQELKEVVVSANKLKYQKFLTGYQGIKIDSTHLGTVTLGNFVQRYGIRKGYIDINPTNPDDLRRANSVQHFKLCLTTGIGSSNSYEVIPIPIFPTIVFNGQFSEYFDDYANVRLEDIDEIYYIKIPGAQCDLLSFVVFTHPDYELNNTPKHLQKSKEFVVVNGYQQPKSFTRPEYLSTTGNEFKKFGIVSWFPKISTEKNGVVSFKVPNTGENELKINLQGYNLSHNYLSESLEVDLNNYD